MKTIAPRSATTALRRVAFALLLGLFSLAGGFTLQKVTAPTEAQALDHRYCEDDICDEGWFWDSCSNKDESNSNCNMLTGSTCEQTSCGLTIEP
jgi:hypothetical protein